MKQLAGLRPSSKAQGDDVTRARFVKLPSRHTGHKTAPMPADATGTRFKTRVLSPDANILVSGHSNVKIGRDVRKGKLRGYWIYTLSLEERATCPSSCFHWRTCFGNSMPFGKRVDHTHPDFLKILAAAIAKKCAQAKKRGSGVLVRLHALGDFYSTHYVNFWCQMLAEFPNLSIYGYTARLSGTAIGWQVNEMNKAFPRRSMIRFSNGKGKRMNTVSIGQATSAPKHAFVCPEQTGKTLGCDTCALCWSTEKTVAFLEH